VQGNLDDREEFFLQSWAAARHAGFSDKEFQALSPRELFAVLELKVRALPPQERPGGDPVPATNETQKAARDHRAADAHVDLLLGIVNKKSISIETWARDHKLGRTTVFDWKAARAAGKTTKGKVRPPDLGEIKLTRV
jgi:hypothetical protein